MARSDLKACISYLAVILEHLYKWDNFKHLVGKEGGKSWVKSVIKARDKLNLNLKRHPSLRNKVQQKLQEAWEDALVELRAWLLDNGFDPEDFSLPTDCPYTYEEAMNRDLRKELKDEGRA